MAEDEERDDVDRLVEEAVSQAREQHGSAEEEMQPAADSAVEQLVADTMSLVAGTENKAARCDTRLLFVARFVRLFAFAAMTVVLLLLLAEAGSRPC